MLVTPARFLLGVFLASSVVCEIAAADDTHEPMAARDQFVQNCSICHLENGEGVEGAFPPLDDRLTRWASSERGRLYLVSVITNGLFGSIDVGGVQYVGAMPPMVQLGSNEIAVLLNYVLIEFAGADAGHTFTESEVAQLRGQAGQQPSRSLRPE